MGAWLFKMAYSEQDSAACPFSQDCNFIITDENAHQFNSHVYKVHKNDPLSKAESRELIRKLDKFVEENHRKTFWDTIIVGIAKGKMEEVEGRFEFFNETLFSLKFSLCIDSF